MEKVGCRVRGWLLSTGGSHFIAADSVGVGDQGRTRSTYSSRYVHELYACYACYLSGHKEVTWEQAKQTSKVARPATISLYNRTTG